MSVLSTTLVVGGCILLIAVGLMSLIHDLFGRGRHEAPLIEDESPRRRFEVPDSPIDPCTHLHADVGLFRSRSDAQSRPPVQEAD